MAETMGTPDKVPVKKTPETSQSEKIKKLDGEIAISKRSLETLKAKTDKSDLDEKQIQELEAKLQKLESEKEGIIKNTQSSLKDEKKLDKPKIKNQKTQLDVMKYVETPKDKQTQKALDMITDAGHVESIDLRKTPEGLISSLLSLLKIIFGGEWQLGTFGKPEQTADDQQVVAKYKEKARKTPTKNFDFYALLDSKKGKNFAQYENMTIKRASRFEIEPGLLLKFMIKEGSDGNLRSQAPGKDPAIGLGQIKGATWELICKTIGPKKGIHMDVIRDRYDAESQIKGMCLYLNYCAELRNVDHATAIIYYHMGPGEINNAKAKKYAEANPAIAKKLAGGPITVASYEDAAKEYYLS